MILQDKCVSHEIDVLFKKKEGQITAGASSMEV
jgi:hypothetical protein